MGKKRRNSSLGTELDRLWWDATRLKWKWREQTENFINMLCFKIGVPHIRLQFCSIYRQQYCANKKPLNCKACYVQKPSEKAMAFIYVRDITEFNYDTMLHELLHHVNAAHDSRAIRNIMMGWYKQFYDEHTGFRKFIKKARENINE